MTAPAVDATLSTMVEGRAICDERAEQCRCHKDAGHVEAGDEVHGCPPDRCTGQWSGRWNDDTFRVVSMPRPVNGRRPWDIP